MIKVKEYLDANFFQSDGYDKSTAELKKNGHYMIFGGWEYPKDIRKKSEDRWKRENLEDPSMKNWIYDDQIWVTCNNETLSINMVIVNGESYGGSPCRYGYLQTYEHISRGEPNECGYYARSTDEEIIKYLDGFLQQIKQIEKK